MKKKIVLIVALMAFGASVTFAQKECTTKEKIECPAGADIDNADDVKEKCTKSYERECKPSNSGNKDKPSGNSGGKNGSSSNDQSRAADNRDKIAYFLPFQPEGGQGLILSPEDGSQLLPEGVGGLYLLSDGGNQMQLEGVNGLILLPEDDKQILQEGGSGLFLSPEGGNNLLPEGVKG